MIRQLRLIKSVKHLYTNSIYKLNLFTLYNKQEKNPSNKSHEKSKECMTDDSQHITFHYKVVSYNWCNL